MFKILVMIKEEILKSNILIAEYMQFDFSIPYSWRPGATCEMTVEMLNYHESMGWLLPVIEKISKLEEFSMISSNEDCWEVSIDTTGYHYVNQAYQTHENLITACWLACIEYIEKFNNGTLKQSKK